MFNNNAIPKANASMKLVLKETDTGMLTTTTTLTVTAMAYPAKISSVLKRVVAIAALVMKSKTQTKISREESPKK